MQDNQKPIKMPHNLIIEDRKKINISGVEEVQSFDDESVVLLTTMGELTVRGSDIKIGKLSTESGDLSITGNIRAISYTDDDYDSDRGFFSRIFR